MRISNILLSSLNIILCIYLQLDTIYHIVYHIYHYISYIDTILYN